MPLIAERAIELGQRRRAPMVRAPHTLWRLRPRVARATENRSPVLVDAGLPAVAPDAFDGEKQVSALVALLTELGAQAALRAIRATEWRCKPCWRATAEKLRPVASSARIASRFSVGSR